MYVSSNTNSQQIYKIVKILNIEFNLGFSNH